MPRYLNTSPHPVDLGTGAFLAPQDTHTAAEPDDTLAEHLAAGRVVELADPRSPLPRPQRKPSEREDS